MAVVLQVTDILTYETDALCTKVKNDGTGVYDVYEIKNNKDGFKDHKDSGSQDKYKSKDRLNKVSSFDLLLDRDYLYLIAGNEFPDDGSIPLIDLAQDVDNLITQGLKIWAPK